MAASDTPKSPATVRAERASERANRVARDKERAADRKRADLLKRLWADEKRKRDSLPWGAERKVCERRMREYEAEQRLLRRKRYD